MTAYPHYIIDVARILRQRSTEAEKLMWERLRNRKLDGLKFNRQHPFGRYIADFYCAKLRLVVELEGEIHQQPDRKEYDQVRNNELESRGLRVMRIPNGEVLTNIERVLQKITELKQTK